MTTKSGSSTASSNPLPRLAGEEYVPIEAWDATALTRAPATLTRFGEGDVLFGPGDILDHAYRIVAGRVNLVLEGPSGRDTVIATAGPGALVGEAFVLTRKPSLLWAIAATDAVAAVYDAADLLGPSGDRPSLTQAAMLSLARKLEAVTQRVNTLTFANLECRIARLLLARVGDGSEGITRLTHAEIARLTGSCRVTVTKVLAKLEAEGLVSARRGFVEVLDPIGLGGVADRLE